MEYYVYIYKNPIKNNQPFYVGKGKDFRYRHHLYPCNLRKDNHKNRIIKKILNSGNYPEIQIIPCKNETEAYKKEIKLIYKYRRIKDGGILVNNLPGGRLPPKNKGLDHPRLGVSKKVYKVVNLKTNEEYVTDCIYAWAKLNNLNATTLVEIATRKVIKRSKKGLPVTRKHHKGYYCTLITN